LSMLATSSALNLISAALAFSSMLATLVEPGIGMIVGSLASSQASEIWPGVAP
jgi:hypothetical protein